MMPATSSGLHVNDGASIAGRLLVLGFAQVNRYTHVRLTRNSNSMHRHSRT